MHISEKLLDNKLPTAYNNLKQKRSQVIHNLTAMQSIKKKEKRTKD